MCADDMADARKRHFDKERQEAAAFGIVGGIIFFLVSEEQYEVAGFVLLVALLYYWYKTNPDSLLNPFHLLGCIEKPGQNITKSPICLVLDVGIGAKLAQLGTKAFGYAKSQLPGGDGVADAEGDGVADAEGGAAGDAEGIFGDGAVDLASDVF